MPKVKPLITKTTSSTSSKKKSFRLKCSECEKEKSLTTNYYMSTNPEYVETGYCDVCKSCLQKMITNSETGMVDKEAFRDRVCKMLDMPFIESEYILLMSRPNISVSNFIGAYKKIFNVKKEYENLRYEDTSKFESDEKSLTSGGKKKLDRVTPEMIKNRSVYLVTGTKNNILNCWEFLIAS